MPASEVHELAHWIARADASNHLEQKAILDRLRELAESVRRGPAAELARCLDAAAVLAEESERLALAGPVDLRTVTGRLVQLVGEALAHAPVPAPTTNLREVGNLLLGEILVRKGVVTRDQVEQALCAQHDTGARIGEALVMIGATSREEIIDALRVQHRLRSHEATPAALPRPAAPAGAAAHSRTVPVAASAVLHDGPGSGFPAPRVETGGAPERKPLELKLVSEMMLGEVLVRRGTITNAELVDALRMQKATGQRVGECVVALGHASWAEIERALEAQQRGR